MTEQHFINTLADVRCPICNGELNKVWFSHWENEYAIFIGECWSGDLNTKSRYHLFRIAVCIETEVRLEQKGQE